MQLCVTCSVMYLCPSPHIISDNYSSNAMPFQTCWMIASNYALHSCIMSFVGLLVSTPVLLPLSLFVSACVRVRVHARVHVSACASALVHAPMSMLVHCRWKKRASRRTIRFTFARHRLGRTARAALRSSMCAASAHVGVAAPPGASQHTGVRLASATATHHEVGAAHGPRPMEASDCREWGGDLGHPLHSSRGASTGDLPVGPPFAEQRLRRGLPGAPDVLKTSDHLAPPS